MADYRKVRSNLMLHAQGDYAYATWTGISGDVLYRNGDGADGSTVTNEWLDRHVRNKGPLARHDLRFEYIMEGDT